MLLVSLCTRFMSTPVFEQLSHLFILFCCIRCKPIQILPTKQPNRILIHKPTCIRLVIAHQVVMQHRLFIEVLVLQSEKQKPRAYRTHATSGLKVSCGLWLTWGLPNLCFWGARARTSFLNN